MQHVVQAVAGQVGGAADQYAPVLDIGAQGVGVEIAVDRIGSAAAGHGIGFGDDVVDVVDVVDVGTIAAGHLVDT
ncbi:hypothetical protein D3C84_357140 [compost metagenome]